VPHLPTVASLSFDLVVSDRSPVVHVPGVKQQAEGSVDIGVLTDEGGEITTFSADSVFVCLIVILASRIHPT
jgi:hypothetical protein